MPTKEILCYRDRALKVWIHTKLQIANWKFKQTIPKAKNAQNSTVTSQLAWTYRNLKQKWTDVTQKNNQMKKRLGMDSIWREEKGQWWEDIGCIINCKSSIWTSQCS